MFKNKKRINSERFKGVLDFGKKVHGENLYISYLKNNLNLARFAVAIPKKVSKNAVKRHRLKRQINAILKEFEADFPKKDYIFFAKSGILDKSFEEIKEEVHGLRSKLVD